MLQNPRKDTFLVLIGFESSWGRFTVFKQLLYTLKIPFFPFQTILKIYSIFLHIYRVVEEYFQEFRSKSLFSRNF